MNNYPTWWDKEVTVYNRNEDKLTNVVKWYRHMIPGCFWKDVGENLLIGNTSIATNGIICRIPKNDTFKDADEWKNIPNDQKENYFTLQVGDIIALGDVPDEIDEYTEGKRSSEFLEKYKSLKGCLVIDRVEINTGGGRGNEHYRVKGQ